MKRFFIIFSFLLAVSLLKAQGGTWVWMAGGPDSIDFYNHSKFGAKGTPDSASYPGGDYEYAYWKDKQNNIWIYSGSRVGYIDLWKLDPYSLLWTWVQGPDSAYGWTPPPVYGTQGVPSVNNNPRFRGYGCATWTDDNGDLWLFGGASTDTFDNFGTMNDLWRYHIATNEWTWMGGPSTDNDSIGNYGIFQVPSDSNLPPARSECTATWVYNEKLYFFGGLGANSSYTSFNDTWYYSVADNTWCWIKGTAGIGNAGFYGTLGVESDSNLPPPRSAFTQWTDACGNFYLWGGTLFTVGTSSGQVDYADVWRYNNTNNKWTWIGGDSVLDAPGSYTHHCDEQIQNGPISRMESRTPLKLGNSNLLYAFGGYSIVKNGAINDLWVYWPETDTWDWVSGNTTPGYPGNYGTKGVPLSTNGPPARSGAVAWIDSVGNFWVFSGWSNGANVGDCQDDLWEFIPDTSCLHIPGNSGNFTYQLSTSSLCLGDSALLNITGGEAISISPNNDVRWIDSVDAVLQPDTSTVFTISANIACGSNSQSFSVGVIHDSLNISTDRQVICSGDTIQICAAKGFISYIWNALDTGICLEAVKK